MRKGIDYCPECGVTPCPGMRNGERVYICWNSGCALHAHVVGEGGKGLAVPQNLGVAVSEK